MITLKHLVYEELKMQPNLLFWLQQDLINITNLARLIRPQIEARKGEKFALPTISMAIRRIVSAGELPDYTFRKPRVKNMQIQLDITIMTIAPTQKVLYLDNARYYSYVGGKTESMLAVSSEDAPKKIKTMRLQKNMAALTVTLMSESSDTNGAYSYIIMLLSLAGIPLAEVATLHDDITLIVSNDAVDAAFNILRKAFN